MLIDLIRRALKLPRDKTTDLAAAEYTVRADTP
jgi:carnitine monooxygenase subunit